MAGHFSCNYLLTLYGSVKLIVNPAGPPDRRVRRVRRLRRTRRVRRVRRARRARRISYGGWRMLPGGHCPADVARRTPPAGVRRMKSGGLRRSPPDSGGLRRIKSAGLPRRTAVPARRTPAYPLASADSGVARGGARRSPPGPAGVRRMQIIRRNCPRRTNVRRSPR